MRNLWLHRYAQLTVVWLFFVIFAGAMVTSTGSGMAVPDWPTSYGVWLPPLVGGVFYETGHRIVAFSEGLLTTALALWMQFAEPRPSLRRLGWLAFFGFLAQGLLGGIAVLIGTSQGMDHTDPLLSMGHACLAQALFATLVSIAVMTAPGWLELKTIERGRKDLRRLGIFVVAAAYVQIILGAVMRHENAGLIIPDFPLSYGQWVPSFTEWRIGINFAHRVGACVVLLLALSYAIQVLGHEPDRWLRVPAWILLFAILAQVSLGACVVWFRLQPIITSAHVLGAALVLSSSITLTLRLYRAQGLERA